jgi:hypothetical protein
VEEETQEKRKSFFDLADFNRKVQEKGIPPVAALPRKEKR